MSESPLPAPVSSRRLKRKLMVVVIGVLVFLFGVREVWTPFSIAVGGVAGVAEIVRVVKTRPSEADIVIQNAVELERQIEPKDRTWTFWCDFKVSTGDGRDALVRLPVGGKHRPSVPFVEPDGSPYTLAVRYDPRNPQRATFPTVLGVWFMPSIILYTGLVTILAGLILLRRDRGLVPVGKVDTDL